jgi:rod shape-determining protein MreC
MNNLLAFLEKYNHWILFVLLEALALVMIIRGGRYQQSIFFTSANVVAGEIYEASSYVSSYFHLKSENEDLFDRNIALQQQIDNLERYIAEMQVDSAQLSSVKALNPTGYELYKASVVNNSINKKDNYITINKGSRDGIKPDMGVIDRNGVIGIVYKTSAHYSLVISLLNSNSNINCKISNSDYFGYLSWEGDDSRYAVLHDLPRHAKFTLGDTIVTSGNSRVFPEGIMVGTIDDIADSNDGMSYYLKIALASDFGKLSSVRVINRLEQEEKEELEKNTIE